MGTDVTRLLNAIADGDPNAAADLLPVVYTELRRLAGAWMARESAGQTLQPTALVHEAFVRLVGGNGDQEWSNRGHFFAAAAESMRRILIENARQKKSLKRGGEFVRRELDDELAVVDSENAEALLDLDEALSKLEKTDPQLAKLVQLRYFAGLEIEETAKILDISPRTVKRNWTYARAWLRRELDHS